MSDKFNDLIELIISEDEDKAKELFHEIVVEKSREIYETLDEDQVEEDEAVEEAVDEDLEEDADEEVSEDEVEESDFEEELGGDQVDDMIDDIESDEAGLAVEADEDDEDMEDRVVDLEDALDELKAEFEKIMAGDDDEPEMDMDMGDEPEMDMDAEEEPEMDMMDPEDDEEEETEESFVREYTEKVAAPSNSEEGDGSEGPVSKAKKIESKGKAAMSHSKEEKGAPAPKAQDMGSTTKPDMKKV